MIGETLLTGLLDRDRREFDLENKPCFLSILEEEEEGSVVVASVREKMKKGLVCGEAFEKIREKCLR